MPGGERSRTLTFRDSEGREHSAVLGYGSAGRSADADHAFEFQAGSTGVIDSFLGGTKTLAVALWEDRSLYLRTPNGRFELNWVDPLGVDDDEHAGEDIRSAISAPIAPYIPDR